MSRRIKLTCTARGLHKPRLLGAATAGGDGRVTFESAGPSTDRDGRGRSRRSNLFAKLDQGGDAYGVYRLLCPSCPLHVEMRQERAEDLIRGLAARGVTTFDLSMY